jgi:hypothetical protein
MPGHSTSLMAERYDHLRPDHLMGAVRALDEALREVDTEMDISSARVPGAQTESPAKPLKTL